MNISAEKLDFIRPDIFSGETGIEALFTLKNAKTVNRNGEIAGLNLGYKTEAGAEETGQNRGLLFKELDLDPDWVAFGEQVHGTRIRVVTGGGTYTGTDGLITRVPNLALAIQVADCAAILLGDPEGRIIGAVHGGWRGAAGGILPKAIRQMKNLGGDPPDIRAFVSPCISLRNFEVGEEVAEQFPDDFVERENFEKPHVDLKAFLKYQMLEEGMNAEHIEIDESCTIADSDRFYSYRREGEQSGRMLGLIMLDQV